jgi:hypothetical protein
MAWSSSPIVTAAASSSSDPKTVTTAAVDTTGADFIAVVESWYPTADVNGTLVRQ